MNEGRRLGAEPNVTNDAMRQAIRRPRTPFWAGIRRFIEGLKGSRGGLGESAKIFGSGGS
jgi:hypothetical protein